MKEFTYGSETTFWTGMNLGDGLRRHPTAFYEIIFLFFLFFFLKQLTRRSQMDNGLLFKVFMLAYFGFRFLIEFIKPNVFYVLGLSSIQWLCITCWLYYIPTFKKIINHAR
jgi:phosphatidylglycerol---prolipoprotein diacylglyceryl transferase